MTIAQQDSIETHFGESSSIQMEDSLLNMHATAWKGYARPDTLYPGECYIMPFPDDTVPGKFIDIDIQTLSSQTFFASKDSLLTLELPLRRQGEAGDPVPYTVRSDNSLTILLLVCFVLFVVSLAHSKYFLAKQMKEFFWKKTTSYDSDENNGELRFMIFLTIVNSLVLSISSYLLANDIIGQSIIKDSGVMLIAVLFASYTIYYILKWMVASIVNLTFFGVKKNTQWITTQLQITALQGVVLFPILALQIYFDFSVKNVLIYISLVLFLNKALTFYKSFQIFFKGNGLYLQTFLYFCSLEIAPMLALGGIGLTIIDTIKINF